MDSGAPGTIGVVGGAVVAAAGSATKGDWGVVASAVEPFSRFCMNLDKDLTSVGRSLAGGV